MAAPVHQKQPPPRVMVCKVMGSSGSNGDSAPDYELTPYPVLAILLTGQSLMQAPCLPHLFPPRQLQAPNASAARKPARESCWRPHSTFLSRRGLAPHGWTRWRRVPECPKARCFCTSPARKNSSRPWFARTSLGALPNGTTSWKASWAPPARC